MNGSPSTPTNPKTTCANCSRAAASHCLPCKNAAPYNGKIQLTKYCGPRCQKLHQITHRLLCHDLSERKAFYRACSLLSDIYFLYREFTLEYQVLKVGRKGWKLRVDLGDRKEVDKEQQEEEDIKVKVIISPLPLMEGSVQDKRAMLAALSGDGHISCFSTIVKTFLNSKYPPLISCRGKTINGKSRFRRKHLHHDHPYNYPRYSFSDRSNYRSSRKPSFHHTYS